MSRPQECEDCMRAVAAFGGTTCANCRKDAVVSSERRLPAPTCIHCDEPNPHPGTRKCTDIQACGGRQEYARGVADERARVVQYLVDRSKQIRGVPRDAVVMLMQSADAIERGEHEEGT